MSPVLLVETADAVTTLRLNRPEARNALNSELRSELIRALDDAGADPQVRVIVLAGSGNTFCSGADMSEFKSGANRPLVDDYRYTGLLPGIFHAIQYVGKPVIAQVNGYALAGGCGLAIACDLVVASERAQFGFPEIHHGFVAAMVMVLLERTVRRKKALELLMLGTRVPATEALEIGMVNRVVPHEQLEDETRALALELAKKDPLAMQLTKDLFYSASEAGSHSALQSARAINVLARQNHAFADGLQRFLDR